MSLLDRAAQEPNSLDRIMLVAVWTATAYAGQVGAVGACFKGRAGAACTARRLLMLVHRLA